MNIPGFTAEASLYQIAKHYPEAATNAAPPNQVVPQYSLCDKAVYYCNRGIEKWCRIEERYCVPEV